jgi:hypothetical protein
MPASTAAVCSQVHQIGTASAAALWACFGGMRAGFHTDACLLLLLLLLLWAHSAGVPVPLHCALIHVACIPAFVLRHRTAAAAAAAVGTLCRCASTAAL